VIPTGEVRQESAITLGKLLQPSSIPFLVQALADPAWEVRLKAANALGALKAKAAVPALVDNLKHPISNLRKEVASALGAIAELAALPALKEAAAQDADIEVRKTALRAVEAIRNAAGGGV